MMHGASGSARRDAEESGRLVVIRPRVVENAEHVLGNLFQRLYHGVERTRSLDAGVAEDLAASVDEVERCLQLVLDYVAPFPPALESVPVGEVAESLAQRVGERLGRKIDVACSVDGAVLVDPGRLGRAFAQMVPRLASGAPGRVSLQVVATGESMGLHLQLAGALLLPRTSMAELQWAVAEKLIEIHAGGLEEQAGPSGEVQWSVSLPRAR